MAIVRSLRRHLRRFRDAREGATAVEFAIVAIPFLALLLGIIELALVFSASVALDNAVMAASRRIRTGELIAPTGSTAQEASRIAFRNEICANMGFMQTDCQTNLYVDVRTSSDFSSIALADPAAGGAWNPGTLTFNTGGASTIVLVRAYYRWTLFAPLMNQALVRLPGQTLLTSVTTFRTEPYAT